MWSIGTILVELVLRVPFLAGDSDIDQLKKTFHAMGTPTDEDWPVSFHADFSTNVQGHKSLPDYTEVAQFPKNPWWNLVASLGKDGQDLCRELLKYDPKQRISAKAALTHRWFTSAPRPTPPVLLPKPLAELKPRDIGPIETKPHPESGTKRKASPTQDAVRNVARKLFV